MQKAEAGLLAGGNIVSSALLKNVRFGPADVETLRAIASFFVLDVFAAPGL